MLKQFKSWTGPGGGTPHLHHKHTKEDLDELRKIYIKIYGNRWREVFAKYYWCVYDGGEIGSTGSD